MWLMPWAANRGRSGLERGQAAPTRPARSAARAGLLLGLCLSITGLSTTACTSADHSPGAGHRAHARTGALAAAYLAIAGPANHRLDVEVTAYADNAHHDLAAAERALRAEAATERWFDDQLARIRFPPAIAATARALIRVNQIRAAMTVRQAQAPSIPALLSLTSNHRAADAQVEAQVRVIRVQLGLPPPSSS